MPLLFFDLISLKSSRESQFFAKSATGKLKLIFDVSKFLSGSNQLRAFGSNGENRLFKFLNYKTFLRCLIFLIVFV